MGLLFIKSSPVKQYSYENNFSSFAKFSFCYCNDPSGQSLKTQFRCMGPRQEHKLLGPRDISVQFVVDLYHGGRFVAVTNHTVRMCTYPSVDYVLDSNLSVSVFIVLMNSLSLETATYHLIC